MSWPYSRRASPAVNEIYRWRRIRVLRKSNWVTLTTSTIRGKEYGWKAVLTYTERDSRCFGPGSAVSNSPCEGLYRFEEGRNERKVVVNGMLTLSSESSKTGKCETQWSQHAAHNTTNMCTGRCCCKRTRTASAMSDINNVTRLDSPRVHWGLP